MKTFEKFLIVINIILLFIILCSRFSKENYTWTMDDTIGNTFATGLATGLENDKHAFQTKTGSSTNDYTLYMGSDKTNKNSYIQSVNYGISTAPLILNYRGGIVKTGGNFQPGANLIFSNAPTGIINIPANQVFSQQFSKYYKNSVSFGLLNFVCSNKNYSNIQIHMYCTGWCPGAFDMYTGIYRMNIWNYAYYNGSSSTRVLSNGPNKIDGFLRSTENEVNTDSYCVPTIWYSSNSSVKNPNLASGVTSSDTAYLVFELRGGVKNIEMTIHYQIIASGDANWTMQIY